MGLTIAVKRKLCGTRLPNGRKCRRLGKSFIGKCNEHSGLLYDKELMKISLQYMSEVDHNRTATIFPLVKV